MNLDKIIKRISYGLVYLILISLIILGIAKVWYFLNTGADRNLMRNAITSESQLYDAANWSAHSSGYQLSLNEKQTLSTDLDEIYQAISRGLSVNSPDEVRDVVSSKEYDRLAEWIKYNQSINLRDEHVFLDHAWKIDYINKDRTLIKLYDEHCVTYHNIYVNEEIVRSHYDTCSYRVILAWEQQRWKLQHLIREETILTNEKRKPKAEVPEVSIGINYLQQSEPWLGWIPHLASEDYIADLDDLKSLKISNIRIFINYHDYGKEFVGKEGIRGLEAFLDACQAKGINCVITLFDFYGDYRISDWPHTIKHVRQIVSSLKDHPALIAWDIKNEPDLDFNDRGESMVLAWLRHIIDEVRSIDNIHPITIGWSDIRHISLLAEELDVVSFHYYGPASELSQDIKNHVSELPNMPIWMTEFGYSSYKGLWNMSGGASVQAEYTQEVLDICTSENVTPFVWTLYDFEEVPASIFGYRPWIKSRQENFGMIDLEGNIKPVGTIISEYASPPLD